MQMHHDQQKKESFTKEMFIRHTYMYILN